jgi:hypothetical protein
VNGLRRELIELKRQLHELTGRVSRRSGVAQVLGDKASGDGSAEQLSRLCSFLKTEYHAIPFSSTVVADGVLSFLGKLYQGNPHDKSIICATGTPYSGQALHQPRNATELQTDSYFCSQNGPNQFLTYDFKNARIAVTHYFLRSNGGGVNDNHLKSWVLEASDDGSTWKEIDRRENATELNGTNSSSAFEVQSIVETRFIRIRTIGLDWGGSQYLYIKAFELFGGLRIRDS